MLTSYSEFCGYGGDSQGFEAIDGVETILAANHAQIAVETHALNFPNADHHIGDITKADLTKFPRADLFWASPSCPAWTDARGKKRDFDTSTQEALFSPDESPAEREAREELRKRRALMEEVPRYLRAIADRGEPVLAGVVENVIQCRKWDQWGRWLREIQAVGYETRVIALNSMHAVGMKTRRAPQSRDRLYVAYWLKSFGRSPDWNKWLRPQAHCPTCDVMVSAIQVFKKPGVDMGRYGRHGQYYYRCPNARCRNQIVHPDVMPALAAIDQSLDPGQKIGERTIQKGKRKGQPDPLERATIARIQHGLERLASRPTAQTRHRDAAVVPPFISVLRGGGSKQSGYIDINTEPLATFSAQGGHQALVNPPAQYLMSYYGNGSMRPVDEPIGTLTTKDRYALIGRSDVPSAEDCTFRMLTPLEIAAGMAFAEGYRVKGNKKQQVMGYGNAVTPPSAEVIGSALVECISGADLPRYGVAS